MQHAWSYSGGSPDGDESGEAGQLHVLALQEQTQGRLACLESRLSKGRRVFGGRTTFLLGNHPCLLPGLLEGVQCTPSDTTSKSLLPAHPPPQARLQQAADTSGSPASRRPEASGSREAKWKPPKIGGLAKSSMLGKLMRCPLPPKEMRFKLRKVLWSQPPFELEPSTLIPHASGLPPK